MAECGWCTLHFEPSSKHQRFCSRKCRQTAFRIRRRRATDERNESPMAFAFAGQEVHRPWWWGSNRG